MPRRSPDGVPGSVYAKRGWLYLEVSGSARALGLQDTPANRRIAAKVKRDQFIATLLPDSRPTRIPSIKEAWDAFVRESVVTESTMMSYVSAYRAIVQRPNIAMSAQTLLGAAVDFRRSTKLSVVTVNSYIRFYSVFTRWCERRYNLRPVEVRSQMVRSVIYSPKVFSADEITRLTQTPSPILAAVCTMLWTGARPVDLLTLTWDDVHIAERFVVWRNKITKRAEPVPVSLAVAKLLDAQPRTDLHVFPDMSYKALRLRFDTHMALAAVEPLGRTLKTLRSTFRHSLRSAPMEIQMLLLRHKTPDVTMRHYTVTERSDVRAELERVAKSYQGTQTFRGHS